MTIKEKKRNLVCMKTIEKKILPEYFLAVKNRTKTFELRKDDSDYQLYDILILKEWDGQNYTGNEVVREITFILRDASEYGLSEGYCILGIQPLGWDAVGHKSPSIASDEKA